jgi:outer membrane protein TolC
VLSLAEARAAAAARDPRAIQPGLLARATRLRIEAIRREAFPQLALSAQATVQNEAPTVPIDLPNGAEPPGAPLQQARAQLEADWSLYDGGRRDARRALEQTRLAEGVAGAEAALYTLREAATETFFGALLLDARTEALGLVADDLQARLRVLRRQAEAGAALAAHAAALEADLLRARQQADEAAAERRAALAVLADLTALPLDSATTLALPAPQDLSIAEGLQGEQIGERPELERFAARTRRAEAEAALARSAARPTVGLFGQAGVGRPSPFDFLSDEVGAFALAGVRLRWAPFDWGRSRREADAARLQAEVARADADAFRRQLAREVEDDRAQASRLRRAIALDARAVALREEALRVARRQLDEGVLLPDAYTDRLTDLAAARLDQTRHRIELSRAEARLLSTLGRFPDRPAAPRTSATR